MYGNLEAELSRKGMTKGELAAKMHLAPSTMSLKLNGKSDFTLEEAARIKELVEVDLPIEVLFAKSDRKAV